MARALLSPGDTLLVDAATYAGAISAFSLAGARLVAVPSDAEGPDMAALERLSRAGAKAFYSMPNCNNPTGAEISTARRQALVAWSVRSGTPLIEDDYGADLFLDPEPPPAALRSLSGDVIYIGTFSKKLVPALRIGFIVCPRALRPTLIALKQATDLGTSQLMQATLAEFLERGYLRAHLARTLPAYRARREALEQGLARHLPPGMTWLKPRRGLVLWLPLPADFESEAVFDEAERRGVLVGPSALYQVEAGGRQGIRLTYCAEPPERLALGSQALGRSVRASPNSVVRGSRVSISKRCSAARREFSKRDLGEVGPRRLSWGFGGSDSSSAVATMLQKLIAGTRPVRYGSATRANPPREPFMRYVAQPRMPAMFRRSLALGWIWGRPSCRFRCSPRRRPWWSPLRSCSRTSTRSIPFRLWHKPSTPMSCSR